MANVQSILAEPETWQALAVAGGMLLGVAALGAVLSVAFGRVVIP